MLYNQSMQKKFLETKAKELMGLLQLSEVTVDVKKQDNQWYLHFQTPNPGVLIGQHGRTIAGLQTIFSLAMLNHFGPEERVIVDVNDYRQQQEAHLSDFARQAAARVRETGRAVAMPPMSAFERRLIHLALANEKDLATNSDGEGRERHVVIYPRPKKSES